LKISTLLPGPMMGIQFGMWNY